MKTLIILPAVLMANCSAAQIDPSQLTPPPTWSLVQERDIVEIKEGDDLTDHYEACYVKVKRVRDKHAITSRWIKAVTKK